MQIVRSVLFNQFISAAEASDRAGVANVAGRLLESLRELGRLTGELREVSGITVNHNVLNLFASPEFTALQEGLLRLGRAHPEARADIIALLRSLDAEAEAPALKPNGAEHAPPFIEGEAQHGLRPNGRQAHEEGDRRLSDLQGPHARQLAIGRRGLARRRRPFPRPASIAGADRGQPRSARPGRRDCVDGDAVTANLHWGGVCGEERLNAGAALQAAVPSVSR
jgi:hypothetical protein